MLISHNLHDIFAVADRITVLRLGRNVAVYDRSDDDPAGGRPRDHGRRADEGRGHRRRGRAGVTTADPQAIDAVPPSNGARRRSSGGASRLLKAGDVGTLPIILGLIGIVAFFYWKNENYLSAGNFTNLMTQMAGVTTIAIGVVFVLLLGEIDLSIGYVAGVAGVIVAQLQIPDESWQVKGVLAIAIAVTVTALIGGLQGSFVAFIGIPSFVVTLAGLLFWQGVILYVIGGAGVIVIEDSTINNVANYFFSDTAGLLIAAVATGLFAFASLSGVVSRRRHGIRTDNLVIVAAQARPLRGRDLRRRDLGEPRARLPARLPARDHLPRLLDVGRRADDVRPPRLRGRRQRRGGTARRHQRAADPRPRLHDLGPDGRAWAA